jgi:hypothetical protein
MWSNRYTWGSHPPDTVRAPTVPLPCTLTLSSGNAGWGRFLRGLHKLPHSKPHTSVGEDSGANTFRLCVRLPGQLCQNKQHERYSEMVRPNLKPAYVQLLLRGD